MSRERLRVLHAIHDFLPRHRAGSEIYACALAMAQSARHDVFVLAAEYDPAVPHGTIRWRVHERLPVVEVVNNWQFASFEETYRSPRLNRQLEHILEAVRPDVVHVHNLLNLTFDLPRLSRQRGAATVATLHDHTLVCASGGQRVHVQESLVCETIDPERCSRCFGASPFQVQMTVGRILRRPGGRLAGRTAALVRRHVPGLPAALSRHVPGAAVTAGDISRRLAYARTVFQSVDLFVAPSRSLAAEYVRLGMPPERVTVSEYGFELRASVKRVPSGPLRLGFVGTLVWHKGLHVLLEACRSLTGSYRLEVFGDPEVFPDYSAELFRRAEGLPVRFKGPFAAPAMPAVYGSFDVLVVPSLWPENSPLVIHEAFMHGVAVVAARTGGIPELVTDGVTGLLYDPSAPAALTRALQTLVDDRGLVASLGAAAPGVKSIQRDAEDWDVRYRQVLSGTACAV
jgi:glycosyltransferase involved in cell wall biosynthesis